MNGLRHSALGLRNSLDDVGRRRRPWCSRRTVPGGPLALLVLAIVLTCATGTSARAQATLPDAKVATPQAIAAALLDDAHDQKAREQLARDAAPRASAIVQALVTGLPDNDETEEYRRIPWIWRVAVAAGRAKDEAALKPLTDASMPRDGERLRDWQAVVLGGGVVMGLSQAGTSPRDVMAPWLADDATRAARWKRSLDLAVAMADDATVRNGTRYDALRMLAVLPWDRVGAQLTRYLSKDVDPELQMGAIGGLSDLQDDRASDALVQHFPQYTERNRGLAITALLKTDTGRAKLKAAIASGAVQDAWLTPQQRQQL
jgi:PAS domain-containing protein